jgi:hypothetical protein
MLGRVASAIRTQHQHLSVSAVVLQSDEVLNATGDFAQGNALAISHDCG